MLISYGSDQFPVEYVPTSLNILRFFKLFSCGQLLCRTSNKWKKADTGTMGYSWLTYFISFSNRPRRIRSASHFVLSRNKYIYNLLFNR